MLGVPSGCNDGESSSGLTRNARGVTIPGSGGVTLAPGSFAVKAPTGGQVPGPTLAGPHSDTALGSDFPTRVAGTRGQHFPGPAALKFYHRRGQVLRLECTVHDATFFSRHRKVEPRDGPSTYPVAPLKKSRFAACATGAG